MRIMIVEDDPVACLFLEVQLKKRGYEIVIKQDGVAAWEMLQSSEVPQIAIIDWMMPEMDGIDLCKKIRESPTLKPMYLIILTTKESRADKIAGLNAGADEYLAKPVDPEELYARIRAGERIARLQAELCQRIADLEHAMSHIKKLEGILPICSYCKKIRDERSVWQPLEAYVADHSDVAFSHGVCPDCYEDIVKPEIEAAINEAKEDGDL